MRPGFKLFIIIAVSLILANCASTKETREIAKTDFLKKNYALAFDKLLPLAKRGDANAQYTISYMYYYGLGVSKDEDVARSWARKSAKKGNLRAEHALQLMLEHDYVDYRSSKRKAEHRFASNMTNKTSTKNKDSGIHDVSWIRQQQSDDYTLVLMETANSKDLEKVIKEKPQGGPLAHYRLKHNGAIYHALSLGSFSNSDQAENSKKLLSAPLRKHAHLAQWQSIQRVMLP